VLYTSLHDGTYQPQSYYAFMVYEPKPRTIYAPAFADLVVQHAIYRVVLPIFNPGFIEQSFACRPGKGTHKAADYAQTALQATAPGSYTLKLDVRKFFYSVDRQTLAMLVRQVIKCPDTLRLLDLFAQRPAPTGIPIGNLMSQTFANLYLNSLDHFCKRQLGVREYGRYMDDAVMVAPSRGTALQWLDGIRQHLGLLGLDISHHSLQPRRRGLNWVGYRTWARARFVRPRLVSQVRADARAGRLQSIVSRLGHARHTASHQPLVHYLTEHHHALSHRLPQNHHRYQHLRAAAA
jgi:hypothetical protein